MNGRRAAGSPRARGGEARRRVAFAVAVVSVATLAVHAARPAGLEAVVGGAPAARADFPYFAVVGKGCGGALIAADRVLSAAHCEQVLGGRPTVRVGPQRISRRIALRAAHPVTVRERERAQTEAPAPADLLLLELRRPITAVAPVEIATSAELPTAPGTLATTIGRGATRPDGGGRGGFRLGVVRVQEESSCARTLPTGVWRRWSLCTRDPRLPDPAATPPFVSACVGDSGGPLLVDRGAGPWLAGVVSFGPHCGARRDPEVYADAVAGREFALAAEPPWAPAAARRPVVEGHPRTGHVLRCAVQWTVRPTRKLRYEWFSGPRFRKRSKRPFLRVGERDRGRRLSCTATGATRGGYGGAEDSRPVRVRR